MCIRLKTAKFSLRVLIVLLSLTTLIGAAHAQPPLAQEVQSQTKNGLTLRIRRAIWDNLNLALPRQSRFAGKGLLLHIEATRAGQPYIGELNNRIVEIKASGPQGEMVEYLREGGLRLLFNGVNPHWKTLNLDFTLIDPAADLLTTQGRFSNDLTFENIPLPTKVGETLHPRRVLQTPQGTAATLESVSLVEETAKRPSYKFVVDIEAPAAIPDLTFETARSGWLDETSDRPRVRWLRARQSTLAPQTRNRQRWEYLADQRLLNSNAGRKEISLRFSLNERAPSLKNLEAFHNFRFELSLQEVADNALPQIISQMQPVRGDGVEVVLENWGSGWNSQPQSSLLRFWTRTLNTQSAAGWLVQEVRTAGPAANVAVSRSSLSPFSPGRSGWRANNEKAATNQHSADFMAPISSRSPATTKREFEVDLIEASRTVYTLNIPDLPLSDSVQALAVNRTVRDDSGAEFTVKSIATLPDNRLPQNWPAPLTSTPPIPGGIALAGQWKPAGGTRTQIAEHRFSAIDEKGRTLLDEPIRVLLPAATPEMMKTMVSAASAVHNSDVTATQETYEFTLFLLPPMPEVTSFNLQIFTEEIMPTGRSQTVKAVLLP